MPEHLKQLELVMKFKTVGKLAEIGAKIGDLVTQQPLRWDAYRISRIENGQHYSKDATNSLEYIHNGDWSFISRAKPAIKTPVEQLEVALQFSEIKELLKAVMYTKSLLSPRNDHAAYGCLSDALTALTNSCKTEI